MTSRPTDGTTRPLPNRWGPQTIRTQPLSLRRHHTVIIRQRSVRCRAMRTHPIAVVVLALSLALTACGGDPEPESAAAVEATPSATPTVTTPAAAPTTPPAEMHLGKTVRTSDGSADVTALAYRQPVAKGAPKPEEQTGFVWGAAEVKVCIKVSGRTVSRYPWVLTYTDGAVIEPSSTGYVHFPNPEYPWDDQPVKPGRCVRGWITFPVPGGKKPAYVQYQPEGLEPIEWRVR